MKGTLDLKQLMKKLKFGSGAGVAFTPNPTRDWFCILGVAAVLFAVIVTWSFTLFMQYAVEHSASLATADPTAVEAVDREQLKRAIQQFTQQSVTFGALKKNPPNVSDPSL